MGEPHVEISENLIYPIYPAAHAKSLRHFFFSSKLNTYTIDNNRIFKLHLPVLVYAISMLSLEHRNTSKIVSETSEYIACLIGRATQLKLIEEQCVSVWVAS